VGFYSELTVKRKAKVIIGNNGGRAARFFVKIPWRMRMKRSNVQRKEILIFVRSTGQFGLHFFRNAP